MNHFSLHYFVIGLLAATVAVGVAGADAIKLSDQWIAGVTIETIADGAVDFMTAGGSEVSRPLAELQGLRIDAHPKLGQAMDAIAQGRYAQAAKLLKEVHTKVRQPWLAAYVGWRLLGVYDRQGEAMSALTAYLQLADDAVPSFYLQEPPVGSLQAADGQAKATAARLLGTAIARADESLRPLLEQLRDAAVIASEPQGTDDVLAAYETADQPSAILLPANMKPNPVIQLLKAEQFTEALKLTDMQLTRSGRLSEKLYLKAMAQLALAKQENAPGRYKDAGISFMRVIVYFPRSRFVGPALVELGFVHERINRTDLARKLYDRAGIVLDEDEDPDYAQRLLRLLGDLP
jgi:tetratricopeptide (TPR) repeat protein